MDLNNYNEILKLTENDSQRRKIILLTEFLFPEQKIQVPDPYYGDEKDFETVYKLIEDSCEKIIEKLFL